jgi:hypothetical protein
MVGDSPNRITDPQRKVLGVTFGQHAGIREEPRRKARRGFCRLTLGGAQVPHLTAPVAQPTYSVKDLAARYNVSELVVLKWIKSGALAAINVNSVMGLQRPRYRITAAALEAFEAARTIGA